MEHLIDTVIWLALFICGAVMGVLIESRRRSGDEVKLTLTDGPTTTTFTGPSDGMEAAIYFHKAAVAAAKGRADG